MEAAYQPPKHGFRTFLIVWVTQSISAMGSAITYFAMSLWLMLVKYPLASQKADLAVALSLVSLAATVPIMVIAPFAGAWADRHDRKKIMFWSDLLNGVVSLTLVVLLVTNTLYLWALLILAAANGVLGTFHNSAFDASYAMLVPEKQLPRANGLMQTMWALSGILPPAIAASIMSLPLLAKEGHMPGPIQSALASMADGTPIAVSLDVFTFVIAAMTLLFLHIPSPVRAESGTDGAKQSIWADIRDGARFIWDRSPLLWLLATFTIGNFAGAVVQVLPPLLLKFNLHADLQSHGFALQTGLAVYSTASSLGGLIGGLVVSVWGGLKKKRVYGVLGAFIVAGAAQVVLGLSPIFYLTVCMVFLISSMLPVMNSHSQTIWQTQTPRELQGRVFSVRRVIAQFTYPIGTAVAGWTGGAFNPGVVVAVFGILLTGFTVAQFFNRALLWVEDKELLDGLAAKRGRRDVVGGGSTESMD